MDENDNNRDGVSAATEQTRSVAAFVHELAGVARTTQERGLLRRGLPVPALVAARDTVTAAQPASTPSADVAATALDIVCEMAAWLPPRADGRGESVGRITAILASLDAGDPHAWERRFMAMLDARALAAVRPQMLHLAKAAAQARIDLDYARLLVDLLDWEDGEREVQRTWARDFWDPEEMTTAEIVATYDLNEYYDRLLRRIAGSEQLPARKSGATWLVPRAAFDAWLSRTRHKNEQDKDGGVGNE